MQEKPIWRSGWIELVSLGWWIGCTPLFAYDEELLWNIQNTL